MVVARAVRKHTDWFMLLTSVLLVALGLGFLVFGLRLNSVDYWFAHTGLAATMVISGVAGVALALAAPRYRWLYGVAIAVLVVSLFCSIFWIVAVTSEMSPGSSPLYKLAELVELSELTKWPFLFSMIALSVAIVRWFYKQITLHE